MFEVRDCCCEVAACEWVVRSLMLRVPVPMLSSFWSMVGPSPAHSPACLHQCGTKCSIMFCPSEQIWDPGQPLRLNGATGELELGRALAGSSSDWERWDSCPAMLRRWPGVTYAVGTVLPALSSCCRGPRCDAEKSLFCAHNWWFWNVTDILMPWEPPASEGVHSLSNNILSC